MNRVRVLCALALATLAGACTDAGTPTGAGGSIALDLVPRFQVTPGTFTSPPIDRIVLRARDVVTSQQVALLDTPVSPTASQWSLDLAVDLGNRAGMDVVVTIQLFSGTTVTWSGSHGPVRVQRGIPASPQPVDVYRGPLDNLDVTSVTISPRPTQMQIGASTSLTATTTLSTGSTATPQIFWTTTDATVATVTQQGSTVTLDAVGAGTVDVIAAAGPEFDEFTLQVVTAPPAIKTWVGGDAAGPTDWHNPANWNPQIVPQVGDEVLVDGSSFDPVLSSDVTVAAITVGSNTVDIGGGDFFVTGDVNAGPNGFINGYVIVQGAGTVLEGSFDRLDIDADRALSGNVTAQDRTSVYGGALDVNGFDLTAASLVVSVTGRVDMTSPSSTVTVAGATGFRGADHAGFLTAGTMSIGGSLFVTGPAAAFAASGTHQLVLFGGSAISVDFSTPGPTASRMNDVLVSNTAGVTFNTDAHVSGDLDVTGAWTVPMGTTTTIEGVLTLASGASFTVNGTVTATGGCVDNGATITGSGTHPCGPPPAGTRTWVAADPANPTAWESPSNWSPAAVPTSTDDVVIAAASSLPVLSTSATVASITVNATAGVDLNGQTLTVAGDVNAGGNGVTNGTVAVTGSGTLLQGTVGTLTLSADRALSGNIIMLGDLNVTDAALDTNGQSVSASGNLTVDGPNGLLVMTNPATVMTVAGGALFNGGDHTGQLTAGFLSVGGDFHATDASPGSFAATGTHLTALVTNSPQSVIFEIPGPNAQRLQDAAVAGPGGTTFSTSATITGDLQVNTSSLMTVPLGPVVDVGGQITLLSGSALHVDGTLTAANGCVDNGATITGTGTQPCGTPSPGTKTWVGGDAADPTGFGNGANWNPPGVPTAADYVIIPSTQYPPTLSLNRNIAGLQVQLGASIDLGGAELAVVGDVVSDGLVTNGLTRIYGAGLLRGNFDILLIEAPRTLTGHVTTASDLNVFRALTIGPYQLSVGNHLWVETQSGQVVMTDQSGVLIVNGNASFNGASATGGLTAGVIALYGGLGVGSLHSATSFHSTGTAVYLVGSVDQAITLSSPTTQRFQDLFISQGGQGAATRLFSDIYVDGELLAGNVIFRAATPGAQVNVQGTASIDIVEFDGVPLRLQSLVGVAGHALDNLTFSNMPTNVVQLYIEVPGGGPNTPLVLSSPVFNTTPTPGVGYYLEAVDNVLGDDELYVELVTPTPTGQTTTYLETGEAVVLWP